MKNSHILIATDFSEIWVQSLPEIVSLVHKLRCTVSLLHVITTPLRAWMQSGALELEAQERLLHWHAQIQEQGIPVQQTLVRSGNAAEEIIVTAREKECTTIMVAAGSHRSFLGSTAEAVVHSAPQSVWVFHPRQKKNIGIQRIICACDISEPSAKALQQAIILAEQCSARLDILYCIELPGTNTLGMNDETIQTLYNTHKQKLTGEFHEFIQTVTGIDHGNSSLPVHVTYGKPSRVILTFAADYQADFLVLGAKGRSNLQILTLGSTTHTILKSIPCSLLVVR